MQFEATRSGDRLFYLNRFADSPEVLAKVEASSMAKIMERTGIVEDAHFDAFIASNRIVGSQYHDHLYGGDGRDIVVGLEGNDEISGGGGDDDLRGGDGKDILHGQDGNDLLIGGIGRDRLYGGNGNDILVGGRGIDFLEGGYGDDVFVFTIGSKTDIVTDFSSGDRLDLSNFGLNYDDLQHYATQQDSNVEIRIGSDLLVLDDVLLSDLESEDFIL